MEFTAPLLRFKKSFLFVLTIISTISSYGQSTLYRSALLAQPVLINPATCGADYVTKGSLSYEKQWMGISQAPSTIYASGEVRLGKFGFYNPKMYVNDTKIRSRERVGMGAGIYADRYGPFREISIPITYSYHLPLNDNSSIGFGITGKIDHLGTSEYMLDPLDPGDPLLDFKSFTGLNVNAGVYLYHDEYFIGVSAVNLFNNKTGASYLPSLNQRIFGITGIRLRNESGTFIMEPSVSLEYRYTEKVLHPDIHIKGYLVRYGWLSLSYLDKKQLAVILAVNVYKNLYVAYKYIGGGSQPGTVTYSSQGIMLGINLGTNPGLTAKR